MDFAWSNDLRDVEADIKEYSRKRTQKRRKEYYQENRDKILRQQRKRDQIRDRKYKEYYQENKERILAANKKRYEEHREERLQHMREYYQAHKEEISQRRKQLSDDKRRKGESPVGEY